VLFGLAGRSHLPAGAGKYRGGRCRLCAAPIAYLFFAGGDTITVLQAVLDTQFLARDPRRCITSLCLDLYGWPVRRSCMSSSGLRPPLLDKGLRKEIGRNHLGDSRALRFWSASSGTVLGGLWADDSWGRFWGWDPKENGERSSSSSGMR